MSFISSYYNFFKNIGIPQGQQKKFQKYSHTKCSDTIRDREDAPLHAYYTHTDGVNSDPSTVLRQRMQ